MNNVTKLYRELNEVGIPEIENDEGEQVFTPDQMIWFGNQVQEHILGIIEERAAHYRHKKRSTPFAGYRQVLIEREVELKELIEKIKG